MFRKLLICSALLAGCGVSTYEASTSDDPTGSAGSELLNGQIDPGHKWSVGVCAGPLNDDAAKGPIGACLTSGTRCTGTLVAPNLVLTARHCVHQIDYSQATGFCDGKFGSPLTSAPVRVTTDPSVLGANVKWREVEQIYTDTGSLSCADDIAILKLKTLVPYAEARPVLVDLRKLTTHKPAEVAVVGRGLISELFDINTYEVISFDNGGLQRRVQQHIPFVCVSDKAGTCVAADIGAPFQVDPGYFQIGSSIASGDSGSGIIRQGTLNTLPILIGVTSAGTVDPVTGITNFGFGTRVDIHAQFIAGTLLRESRWGALAPPATQLVKD